MIRLLVNLLEFVLNAFYRKRLYARFYVLETVARVPYFSFLSVLHLYESLGWWRKSDWLKVHFAEYWNELYHLLIAESLGGNKYWIDRFVAGSGVIIYYWILVFIYVVSPSSAYYFTQLVEEHVYHTYDTFLKEHEAELKTQPAPQVAINYYRDGDLYMFDEFQTSHQISERRPKIDNLYDVYVAIRDDEGEHIKTMLACQQPDAQLTFKSPHSPEAKPLPEKMINAINETAESIIEDTNADEVLMS
ncbi:MAG: alternative oxidase [Nostoc sp.]|uniref:alternative oxidase n=1 Tax=Nostoc sp. TaxID=1180 RepID=UPI002FF4B441